MSRRDQIVSELKDLREWLRDIVAEKEYSQNQLNLYLSRQIDDPKTIQELDEELEKLGLAEDAMILRIEELEEQLC